MQNQTFKNKFFFQCSRITRWITNPFFLYLAPSFVFELVLRCTLFGFCQRFPHDQFDQNAQSKWVSTNVVLFSSLIYVSWNKKFVVEHKYDMNQYSFAESLNSLALTTSKASKGAFYFNNIIIIRHRGTMWLNDSFGRYLRKKSLADVDHPYQPPWHVIIGDIVHNQSW